jgi:predicted transcriptional regulator
MSEVKLHVGDVNDMGKRFVDAWKQLEKGQQVEERHLTFFSLDAMMATLSQKRLEILKHLHRQQEKNVATLARALNRDYKRVYTDIDALAVAGLIERDAQGIRTLYDSVQATVSLN